MWRMNTARNIEICMSINSKPYCATISSSVQRHQVPINPPLIHMIWPAMMRNTWRLTMWLRRHPDEAIMQPTHWPPPGSIWIRRLTHQWTGDKLIEISMITAPTQWRLVVYLESGHIRLVAPTGRKALKVRRYLQCDARHILYHMTWCRSGGQSFLWPRCYCLEGVINHRQDRSQKSRRNAVCSS